MPSLTRVEAATRAATITVSRYAISLDLTGADEGATTFSSRTTISFTATGPTFLDIVASSIESAQLNGTALDTALLDDGRLPIPATIGDNTLVIAAAMRYSGDGEGMHRHVDPADGKTYLYAMSFLDAGPRWFACFDQPDLKARYDVSVRCPAGWTVLGNGSATQTPSRSWVLATTQPLSTYYVTLVAGPYHSVRAEHDGIPLGLHARASLSDHLDRQAPELLALTRSAIDYYHRLYGVRYAFGDYHQAFVPDFNAGAMENPGCVTLRDQYVFRSATTEGERGIRANTIVHEMAHMWFGDLVTMTWWDDLWLNESFAEYMAHRACSEITDYAAWSEFGIGRKDWGYVADQAPSTHPVAGNGSPDAATALADFDGISYAKGAAVLRQLASFLGDDVFFGGLRDYFATHAFGNAEFSDLIAAWETAGGIDVDTWATDWLRHSGVDTLTAEVNGEVVKVTRESPDSSNRSHSVRLVILDAGGEVLHGQPLSLAARPVSIAAPAGSVLAVADADDETWAKVRFGNNGWAALAPTLPKIKNRLTRVVGYNAIRDAVRDAALDPSLAMTMLLGALGTEADDLVVSVLLNFSTATLAGTYSPVVERPARLRLVAATAEQLLAAAAPGSDAQLTAARVLIRSSTDSRLLERWLAGEPTVVGLSLDAELRWAVVERIATLGSADAGVIEGERRRDQSASGAVHAARAMSLRPDAAAKAAAWKLLTQPNELPAYELYATAEGFFEPSQGAVTSPYVSKFFTELPATAAHRGGWALARIILLGFPGTSTEQQTLDLANATIADPAVDPRVRRSLVDATDALRRSIASLQRFGT